MFIFGFELWIESFSFNLLQILKLHMVLFTLETYTQYDN